MQQRRFRPGDVVDDYCPRERRITDHAVVAMIEDHIKQTRCCVCDAEHEFKDGKVPAQRKRRPKPALFNQVLEGLQGQPARLAHPATEPVSDDIDESYDPSPPIDHHFEPELPESNNGHPPASQPEPLVTHADNSIPATEDLPEPPANGSEEHPVAREEGPVRRPLIRATLPRPEGQPPVTRAMPEFTIRQPNNGRGGGRPGGRRRGGQPQGQGHTGPMRFGRGGGGQGSGQGQGQGQGQRQHGGRSHGSGGRRRRGGKKR
jgi:hypothetical protein